VARVVLELIQEQFDGIAEAQRLVVKRVIYRPRLGLPEEFGHALAATPAGPCHRGVGFGDDPFDAGHHFGGGLEPQLVDVVLQLNEHRVGEYDALGSSVVAKDQGFGGCAAFAKALQSTAERGPCFRR
jgi:hypothetical protein